MRPLPRDWKRCAHNRSTGSCSRQPRQRWVDALSLSDAELASIEAPVLLIHGIDDPIVPPEHSVIPLLHTLPNARAHLFGRCGHASPLEYTAEFNRLVATFLETPNV